MSRNDKEGLFIHLFIFVLLFADVGTDRKAVSGQVVEGNSARRNVWSS